MLNKKEQEKIKYELIKGNYVLVICGPTCSGKSRAAIGLADIFDTHIISVDSMQVYRGMDIGTDKMDTEHVKQYMTDLFEPNHYVTAVKFRDMCRNLIKKEFFDKKRLPILVGGSGLYIRGVLDKLDFAPEKNNKISNEIKKGIQEEGPEKYFQILEKADPEYSKKISQNDVRRIIRGLEVYRVSGKPYSSYQRSWQNRISICNTVFIGLHKRRETLYEHIGYRVDEMFGKGLVDEVRTLMDKGYGQSYALRQAVGYKEVVEYINGKISLQECMDLVKKNTRNLAKKQFTWFRADPRVNWIRVDNYDSILSLNNEIISVVEKKIDEKNKFFQTKWSGK